MKNLTAATIKKVARENGIDMALISLHRNYTGVIRIEDNGDAFRGLDEIQTGRKLRKYNRAALRLATILRKEYGATYWGLKSGYGAWAYEMGSMSESTKLALANVD